MKQFEYVIQDKIGIHARPAGMLVKEAKKYKSKITVESGGKVVEATKLMSIMGMGIKCGSRVIVCAEGDDESEALLGMQAFFEENL